MFYITLINNIESLIFICSDKDFFILGKILDGRFAFLRTSLTYGPIISWNYLLWSVSLFLVFFSSVNLVFLTFDGILNVLNLSWKKLFYIDLQERYINSFNRYT